MREPVSDYKTSVEVLSVDSENAGLRIVASFSNTSRGHIREFVGVGDRLPLGTIALQVFSLVTQTVKRFNITWSVVPFNAIFVVNLFALYGVKSILCNSEEAVDIYPVFAGSPAFVPIVWLCGEGWDPSDIELPEPTTYGRLAGAQSLTNLMATHRILLVEFLENLGVIPRSAHTGRNASLYDKRVRDIQSGEGQEVASA